MDQEIYNQKIQIVLNVNFEHFHPIFTEFLNLNKYFYLKYKNLNNMNYFFILINLFKLILKYLFRFQGLYVQMKISHLHIITYINYKFKY